MRLLTFDYGGTFIKYGITDENAVITKTGTVPAPLGSVQEYYDTTRKIYEQFAEDIDGVAISMPGVINSEAGYAASAGAYTAILGGKNIPELLDFIDKPVSVENDGKAAILAELWKGSLQGIENAAACIIGSGLGGAIVMDGKLRKGGHFASGEISGIMMKPGNYDMSNCAAAAAGMSSFLMQVAAAKNMDPADFEVSSFNTDIKVDANKKRIGGKEVFEWIENEDPETLAVYDRWLDNLTLVLFNMKMTLDPEKIVIGGGVSKNPRFIHDLKEKFRDACAMLEAFGIPLCDIDVCHFSSEANMIGAAYNWLLHYGGKND